jgi:hypothetical protein
MDDKRASRTSGNYASEKGFKWATSACFFSPRNQTKLLTNDSGPENSKVLASRWLSIRTLKTTGSHRVRFVSRSRLQRNTDAVPRVSQRRVSFGGPSAMLRILPHQPKAQPLLVRLRAELIRRHNGDDRAHRLQGFPAPLRCCLSLGRSLQIKSVAKAVTFSVKRASRRFDLSESICPIWRLIAHVPLAN